MENIVREANEDSPEIVYLEEANLLKIVGNSYPENCEVIYEPIKKYLGKYSVEENPELNLYFHFNLINSTSTVYIAQIIVSIAELVKKGLKTSITWCYDQYDEELLDLGQKLAFVSKLPFEYEAIPDED